MTKTTQQLFNEIRQHLIQSQLDEAFEKLYTMPLEAKGLFDFTMIESRLYILKKDFKKAEEVLRHQIDTPNHIKKWQFFDRQCQVYFQTKQAAELSYALNRLRQLDAPLKIQTHWDEQFCFLSGDYAGAAKHLMSALGQGLIEPSPAILHKLVRYHALSHEHKSVIATWELGIEKYPNFDMTETILLALQNVFSTKELINYLIDLHYKYPENSSLEKWLSLSIYWVDLDELTPIFEENSKRISHSLKVKLGGKISIYSTEYLSEPELKITDKSSPLDVDQAIYRYIENNDIESAKKTLKNCPDEKSADLLGLLNSLPEDHTLTRPKLKALENSSVIVTQSRHAIGTVIVFPGLFGQVAHLPLPIIDLFFSALNLNAIYLNDNRRCLFLNGIKELGNNLDETIIALKNIVSKLNGSRLFTFSNSGGGMGAIRYGIKMNAEAALCFSPPSNLLHPEETRAKVFRNRLSECIPKDQLSLQKDITLNNATKIYVYFGEDNFDDSIQAQTFNGFDNIELYPIKGFKAHHSLLHMASAVNLVNLISRHFNIREEYKTRVDKNLSQVANIVE